MRGRAVGRAVTAGLLAVGAALAAGDGMVAGAGLGRGAPPALALSADPFFEREAGPGGVVVGFVRVRNRGPRPVTVEVTLHDYRQDGGGRPLVEPAGTAPFGAGAWVRVSPRRFVLKPGGEEAVGLRVRVPASAVTGSYGAVVFFGAEVAGPPLRGSGTRVTGRLGTVVLVRVRGAAAPRLAGAVAGFSFRPLSFSYPVPFLVRYRNTGNVHARVAVEVELTPLGGGRTVRQVLARRLVLPGAAVSFPGRLEGGPALAAYRMRARALGDQGDPLGVPTDGGWLVVAAWPLPAGLLLTLAGGLALIFFRRWAVPPGRAAPSGSTSASS